MLKSMKVVHRILLVAIVALTGMIAIAASGAVELQHSIMALNNVYQNRVVPLRDIKMIADLYAIDIVDTAQKAESKSLAFNAAIQQIENAETKISSLWNQYLHTELTDNEKKLVNEIDMLRTASQEPLSKLKSILAKNDLDAIEEFNRLTLYAMAEPLSRKFNELIQLQLDVAKNEYEQSIEQKTVASALNVAVVFFSALICIALSVATARQIKHELGGEPFEATRQIEHIAAGHLEKRIVIKPGLDGSMLAAVERMRTSLSDILFKIRSSSSRLESDSAVMYDDGNQVLEAANIQSESASAIASAVEEMSSNISNISDSAASASQNSHESSQAVLRGIDVVQHSLQGMNGILEATTATAESIKNLAEKSSEIGKIIHVIKDIADQTNLLALNAAIEAARAGEAGRGFAVVADEVRQLAERTATSTSEIVDMVETIRAGTNGTLTSTSASQMQVADGVQLANHAGASMHEVQSKIDETLVSVNAITHALNEQSTASQLIGRDIERIAQMAETNRASVAKLKNTAADIRNLAAEINVLTSRFQL